MVIAELLDQLEHEARERAWSLESRMNPPLPQGFTHEHYPLTVSEARELRRLKAAARAATDVDTFVALCKGYPVPESRLRRRPVEQYDRMRNGS